MLLRPRKFIHKNRQKSRNYLVPRNAKLVYGQIGVKLLQPMRLYSKQMFRLRIFIKKASRRSEKTYRHSWILAFPHLPLTKKVSGSRMGKGKGKLSDWVCLMPSGSSVVEFKNLRFGRAIYFCKQVVHKLPATADVVSSYKDVPYPYNPNTKRQFEVSW